MATYDDKPKNDDRPELAIRSNSAVVRFIIFLAIGGVLLCGLSVGGFVYILIRATQPVVDASSAYLQALSEEDYAAAYDMLTSGAQSEYETLQAFQTDMRESTFYPTRWNFNSREVNGIGTDASGQVMGTVTNANGRKDRITIWLDYDGERWRISGVGFR